MRLVCDWKAVGLVTKVIIEQSDLTVCCLRGSALEARIALGRGQEGALGSFVTFVCQSMLIHRIVHCNDPGLDRHSQCQRYWMSLFLNTSVRVRLIGG